MPCADLPVTMWLPVQRDNTPYCLAEIAEVKHAVLPKSQDLR
jgi:hypothetical protein